MTDNEIIKALECIASKKNLLCDSCPNKKFYLLECHRQGAKNALDLINRQKADLENYKQIAENQQSVSMDKEVEIKRLKAEVEQLQKENHLFADIGKMYSEVKAEAVKEFAERLKQVLYNDEFMLIRSIIDNLLKEMGVE